MKKLIAIAAVSALSVAAALSFSTMIDPKKPQPDKKGHILTALWNSYESAAKADKPKTALSVLSKIKEQAIAGRYPVDFYDAASEYADISSSRNWKLRDSLLKAFDAEVEAFAEPVVTFVHNDRRKYLGGGQLLSYAREHKDRLASGKTSAFYEQVSGIMSGALEPFVNDDYEYALWRSMTKNGMNEDAAKDLEEYLDGRYPNAAMEEYVLDGWRNEKEETRLEARRKFAGKYSGKAVALFAEAELLSAEFDSLRKDKASSAQYKAFYGRLGDFEKRRAAFKGDEKTIASAVTTVSDLRKALTWPSVSVGIVEGKGYVYFRNMSETRIRLSYGQGKTLLERTVKNPAGSFYALDTVAVDLPITDDGTYEFVALKGKETQSSVIYEKYTLSMATRKTSEGMTVYVTDYKSGKPAGNVEIVLGGKGKEVSRENVAIDGFTLLPSGMQRLLSSNNTYVLHAELRDGGILRKSSDLYCYAERYSSSRQDNGEWVGIFRDRGAYNPGDQLKYKVLFYGGDRIRQLSVKPGESLSVVFSDSEGKEIGSQKIKTGDFGTASGTFLIPRDRRNGMFSMRVNKGGRWLASASFRVDEFVLPTFSLLFDDRNELLFPGDEARVSGRLESYTGHSLGEAKVKADVRRYGGQVSEMDVPIKEDGSFDFAFPVNESGFYSVTLTVTDLTGETQEFSTSRYVPDGLQIDMDVENQADAEFTFPDNGDDAPLYSPRRYGYHPRYVVTDDYIDAKVSVVTNSPSPAPADIRYTVSREDGTVIREGMMRSGEKARIALDGAPCGRYELKTFAEAVSQAGKTYKDESKAVIVKLSPSADILSTRMRDIFVSGPLQVARGEKISLRAGSTEGHVWGLATLFGERYEVLDDIRFELEGVPGERGSVKDIVFDYKDEYPDAVRVQVFWFADGRSFQFEREFSRIRTTLDLPLEFSAFEDRTMPSARYTFSVRTAPETEVLAAVFDKSLDAIAPNSWGTVRLRDFHVDSPSIMAVSGKNGDSVGYAEEYDTMDELPVMYASSAAGTRKLGMATRSMKSASAVNDAGMMVLAESAEAEEAMSFDDDAAGADEGVILREAFSTALAFEPHLMSDASGNVSFSFTTSDKLSTYHVALYAHDKSMRNNTLTRDMIVTIPVKLSVSEPRTLYDGDRYEFAASVSSIADKPISGRFTLQVYPSENYDGEEPVFVKSKKLTVPAGGSAQVTVPFDVKAGDAGIIGLRAVFVADKVSDGVFLTVPVKKAEQTLTETHSAVLLSGGDKDAAVVRLRKDFVNIPGSAAAVRVISIRDMVLEAIPDKVDPEAADVLSLTEALYVRRMAGLLGAGIDESVISTAEIVSKIAECRNSDGGYGWFPGFRSSQVITATVLERFALLRERGFAIPDVTASVRYLDDTRFSSSLPYWCGYLSAEQYMYVRSMYPEVAFKPAPEGDKSSTRKNLEDFKEYASDYLVPSKKDGRGLNGRILTKARRLLILRALSASPEGVALAKAWGIKGFTGNKLEASLKADYESLVEYAIRHRDGGWYYPNAVMPLRGLLENEAYAHALLSRLMDDAPEIKGADPQAGEIASGIRIWLMLQKESQNWAAGPEFVDALDAVLKDEKALETKVVVLSGSYTAPLKDIKAAGNGFTLKRSVSVLRDGKEIPSGGTTESLDLKVGDRVTVRYEIWNQENRSFVSLVAPREGCLMPENQLSGHYGWRFRPIRAAGWYSFSPQGYREVKAGETRYYFDTFPEENTVIEEEFFVTQAGRYVCPVPVVESLYAPHYRANAEYAGDMEVSR